MLKRAFDIITSIIVLIIMLPVFLIISLLIKVSSPGPILYPAIRAGLKGKKIRVHKFRSMHVSTENSSRITSPDDNRVFPLGAFLRATKLDELPQFFDVLIGNLTIVGPRPEELSIVKEFYSDDDMKTLDVKPGIASPGSLFNYTHGDYLLDNEDSENSYKTSLLPIKLALEHIYIQKNSLRYDLSIILRTVSTILAKATKRHPPPPNELTIAVQQNLIPDELKAKVKSILQGN